MSLKALVICISGGEKYGFVCINLNFGWGCCFDSWTYMVDY